MSSGKGLEPESAGTGTRASCASASQLELELQPPHLPRLSELTPGSEALREKNS